MINFAAPQIVAAMPYLLGAALLLGAGTGSCTAWKIQAANVAEVREDLTALQNANVLATALRQGEADRAGDHNKLLESDLAKAQQIIVLQRKEIRSEIEVVASHARQCLSVDLVRVLRPPADRPAARESKSSPQPAEPPIPGPSAPAGPRFISELAMGRYLEAADAQFLANREAFRALALVVVELEKRGFVEFTN